MVKRLFISSPLNILEFDAVTWEHPRHTHNFYEIIFILQGSGKHLINDIKFSYEKGDVFLLTPKDTHEFFIDKHTFFGYVRFTDQILEEKMTQGGGKKWKNTIQMILEQPNISPQEIVKIESDRDQLFKLYDILKQEYRKSSCNFSRFIVLEIFGAMITLIARNIYYEKVDCKIDTAPGYSERINELLTYIRRHIADKEKISMKNLSKTFNMSENYIGVYLKNKIGKGVREMVIETKITAAKRLLDQSDLNISEIAYRLDFVDHAHFSKTFKKHTGQTPKDYRERGHPKKPRRIDAGC